MSAADEIRKIINGLICEISKRFSLEYRLPAPVAFARADDPLWGKIKEIHPWISSPREILADAKTVVVYAVPLTWEAILTNVGGFDPSIEWLRDYAYTNRVIDEVSRAVANHLEKKGHKSVGLRATHDFDSETLKSSWSHRHAGYVAGLGMFGINRLLITERGCAVRLGSVITALEISPTPRPDGEYCLEKKGIKCGKCVENCPIKAFDNWDKMKNLCWHKQLLTLMKNEKYADMFGYSVDACGKCAVGIPCATGIPGR